MLVQGYYPDYVKYSKLVNEVYLKYTDRVEPCSIDESFLDVTSSKALFGSPYEIAYKIKEEITYRRKPLYILEYIAKAGHQGNGSGRLRVGTFQKLFNSVREVQAGLFLIRK